MMESPAPKEAIVLEVCVKSEHSLGLEGVFIKSEPSWSDECVKDEPSCSDTCVKDEPSSPEVADARSVSEAAAAARLYADHFLQDSSKSQKLLAYVKQELADPDETVVTPMSVKQESKWEAEEDMVQPKWEIEMMASSHGEPKNEAEGNMSASHGEPTVYNVEVKQELLKCEAHDCKLNEPENRMPAPNTLKRTGPKVYKRIWLPNSDFDGAVIGSTRPSESPVKRVVVSSSPVQSPVADISQPTHPLITAIRESRCRNMLEMFPEISPLDIKNTLVKHGWNEKRSRDELRSVTRKATTRLRRRARTRARAQASPDKDPDLTAPIWA